MCPQVMAFMAVASSLHSVGQASKVAKDAAKQRQAATAEQKREAESQKAASSLEALQSRRDTYSARRKGLAASMDNFTGQMTGFGPRSFFSG